MLTGSEVKNLREGRVSLMKPTAACAMTKSGSSAATFRNTPTPRLEPCAERPRKLLLHREVRALRIKPGEKGLTLVPFRMYFNERGVGGRTAACRGGPGLANRPRLLLADEPTANVDPANQQTVVNLIRDTCREEGIALLLVTHARNGATVRTNRPPGDAQPRDRPAARTFAPDTLKPRKRSGATHEGTQ